MRTFIFLLLLALSGPVVAQPSSTVDRSTKWREARTKARSLLKEGKALVRQKQFDKALARFKQALATYPNYPLAYNEIGIIHSRNKVWNKARKAFKKATEIYPGFRVAWVNLAELERQRSRFVEASAHYVSFLALRPKDPDGYYGLALTLWAQKNWPSALYVMKRYVRLKRLRDARKRSEVKLRITDLEKKKIKARDEIGLKRAITVARAGRRSRRLARKSMIKNHNGDISFNARRYEEALFAYLVAFKKKPADVTVIYKIGATYAVLRDYREAARWWSKALALAPGRRIIFEHLVLATLKMAEVGELKLGGETKANLTSAKAVLEQDPTRALVLLLGLSGPDAQFVRGSAALKTGHLRLALKIFGALKKTYPKDHAVTEALAETLVRLNDMGRARKLIDSVAKSKGKHANAFLKDRASQPSPFTIKSTPSTKKTDPVPIGSKRPTAKKSPAKAQKNTAKTKSSPAAGTKKATGSAAKPIKAKTVTPLKGGKKAISGEKKTPVKKVKPAKKSRTTKKAAKDESVWKQPVPKVKKKSFATKPKEKSAKATKAKKKSRKVRKPAAKKRKVRKKAPAKPKKRKKPKKRSSSSGDDEDF